MGTPGLHLAWPVLGREPSWPRLFLAKSSDGLGWREWAGTLAAGSCWAGGQVPGHGHGQEEPGGPPGGQNHTGPLLWAPWELCLAPLRLATPAPCTRTVHPKPRPGHSPDGSGWRGTGEPGPDRHLEGWAHGVHPRSSRPITTLGSQRLCEARGKRGYFTGREGAGGGGPGGGRGQENHFHKRESAGAPG